MKVRKSYDGRAASCPGPGQSCGWDFYYSGSPNVHDLKGALVGGPNQQDQWADDRTNYAVCIKLFLNIDIDASFVQA